MRVPGYDAQDIQSANPRLLLLSLVFAWRKHDKTLQLLMEDWRWTSLENLSGHPEELGNWSLPWLHT